MICIGVHLSKPDLPQIAAAVRVVILAGIERAVRGYDDVMDLPALYVAV
jgi:hypothetical protein